MSNALQQCRRLCKLAAVSGMCFCLVLSTVSCAGGPHPSVQVNDPRLHDAARDGRNDIVSELIERGARLDARGKDDNTPLHYAALKGHRGVVELLIANGAKVNPRDSDRNTPLHYAAQRGHRDVVELFIAKGAKVNARAKQRTVMSTTLAGITPLNKAAEAGHKDVVEMLIAHGAGVNAREDPHGDTPLHNAINFTIEMWRSSS